VIRPRRKPDEGTKKGECPLAPKPTPYQRSLVR
jgi:hypothetical protein